MIDPASAPNVNAAYAAMLIEELLRQGVQHFVIAPGSRSAPLVAAVARDARARAGARMCHDERGAGFVALGLARATGMPAAVITTSGSAVANLWPAVVEARQDRVPLLLLTADRPPELRECGANQAIPQAGIFGGHVRWHVDVPCPDDRVPVRVLLTTADHAVARARDEGGPVHLNLQFREPLAPDPVDWNRGCLVGTEEWARGKEPFTRIEPRPAAPAVDAVTRIAARIRTTDGAGLIIAGSLPDGTSEAVETLAVQLGWPVVADVRSGLRLGATAAPRVLHADALLDNGTRMPTAGVLQLGGQLVSKHLPRHLRAMRPAFHVVVDAWGRRLDPDHAVTEHVVADPARFCQELGEHLQGHTAAPRHDPLHFADGVVEDALVRSIDEHDALTEPWAARWLSRRTPADHALFVASSMPIRDVHRFAVADGPRLRVAANRGASGIDGLVASALGFAAGHGTPVTLLIGDVALLHDVGSLALLRDAPEKLIVVVLNNGGGAIFERLPIARHEDLLSPWFTSPHRHDFAGVAASFGLDHHHVTDRAAFETAHAAALQHGGSTIIEVDSDIAENGAHHERIDRAIADALGG